MKITLYILLVFNPFICFSQIEFKNIDSVSLDTYSYFRDRNDHVGTKFTGTDSIYGIHKKDTILLVINYNYGHKTAVTGYYESGNKWCEMYFKNDVKDGMSLDWDKNGQLLKQYYFEKGIVKTQLWFYDNGSLFYISTMNEQENTGWSKSWRKDGSLENEYIAIDTTKEGSYSKSYYDNNQLEMEYIANLGEQPFSYFFRNGILGERGKIYNGPFAKIGLWETWYENGVKSREYHYSGINVPEGTWKWWDEEGKLTKQETYKNGELIDTKDFINKKKKGE